MGEDLLSAMQNDLSGLKEVLSAVEETYPSHAVSAGFQKKQYMRDF